MSEKFNFSTYDIARKNMNMYANLYGTAGSGKTYSALLLATALASSNNKVVVIDIEHRVNIYDKDFPEVQVREVDIDTLTIRWLLEAVKYYKKQGFECVVIDGLTSLWDKICAKVDELGSKPHGAHWKSDKRQISAFSQILMRYGIHIITTTLAVEILDKDRNPTGKLKPSFERPKFDPHLNLQLLLKDNGVIHHIDKSWHHDLSGHIKLGAKLSYETGKFIKTWLGSNGVQGNVEQDNSALEEIIFIEETLNKLFEEMKDLSSADRKKLFSQKDMRTQKIYKENAGTMQERFADYEQLKQLTTTEPKSFMQQIQQTIAQKAQNTTELTSDVGAKAEEQGWVVG